MNEKIGDLTFTFAKDNHEPPRDYGNGKAEVWRTPEGIERIRILRADETFTYSTRSLYLIDDGSSVVPHYVAGWSLKLEELGNLLIEPMPTNPDGRQRADNGRVIDFSNWMLGPKRAYHLKIKRV